MAIVFLPLRLSAAAIKQKEKQKADKEAGIKPRKIPEIVEEGNDDCGDDLKGLGVSAYYTDAPMDSDTDSNGEEETFITLFAGQPAESYAD
eukprot:9224553-Pyramimonas_sp.AAC.1